MSSILKRISPTSWLDRHIKELAHIHFKLDEPSYVIKKKFSTISENSKYFHTFCTHLCNMCDNSEISSHAKFCRICGSEFPYE